MNVYLTWPNDGANIVHRVQTYKICRCHIAFSLSNILSIRRQILQGNKEKQTSLLVSDGTANCQNKAVCCYKLGWVFLAINYNFPCV